MALWSLFVFAISSAPGIDIVRAFRQAGVQTSEQNLTSGPKTQSSTEKHPVDVWDDDDYFEDDMEDVGDSRVVTWKDPKEYTVSPIVWVPGITSTILKVRRLRSHAFGHLPTPSGMDCDKLFPEWASQDEPPPWKVIYVSASRSATAFRCILWALELQAPDERGCVHDQPGLEIREESFGGVEGVAVLNPDDVIHYKLYEPLIERLEDLGYERGTTIRFASYDWRKYTDPCWTKEHFHRMIHLIEETSNKTGQQVILGCHSMGCPLLHNFLDRAPIEWRRKFIQHFIATGPAFAGSATVMQNFVEGPLSNVPVPFPVTFGRKVMVSMPGFYSLLPTEGAGDVWGNQGIIATGEKEYGVSSLLYDLDKPGSFFYDVEVSMKPDPKGSYGLLGHLSSRENNSEPWCWTEKGCGFSVMRLKQDFWDYCTYCKAEKECSSIHEPDAGREPEEVCDPGTEVTYRNRCEAENALRCFPRKEIKKALRSLIQGPCVRRTPLKQLAAKFLRSTRFLQPPQVAITCIFISDVKTPLRWEYDDFSERSKRVVYDPNGGDGTINAISMRGPCEWFKANQKEGVQLIELQNSGNHVGSLHNDNFLDTLMHAISELPPKPTRL